MNSMNKMLNSAVRVYLYARVSTPEQAEKDLSLPAQLDALRRYATDKGYAIVEEFVEPGVSATDDHRKQFQRMVVQALGTPRPVDIILVFATSRFMRSVERSRVHKAKLKKHGIRVVAIKQETDDDATGHMMEGIFEVFDEYESEVNGMRTSVAMAEAARQGFFPGSRAPFGFEKKPVRITEKVTRYKLRPNPDERDLVTEVFRAYVPRGGKSAARDLNTRGYRYRNGAPFTRDLVMRILDEEAAIGTYQWGKHNHRTQDAVQRDEWIAIPCEPIVDRTLWDLAQRLREERDPDRAPGRTASSPLLLTGRARCGKCGAAYQLETSGKSRGSERPYRYYNCRTFTRSGRETCSGYRIPAARLEAAVLEHLAEQLFTEERCRSIIRDLVEGQGILHQRAQQRRRQIESELRSVENKILKWQEAYEDDAFPKAVVRERLTELEQKRSGLTAERGSVNKPTTLELSDGNIGGFRARIRAAFLSNDGVLAKQYVHALIDRVDINDAHVRIRSRPEAVAHLLAAPPNTPHEVAINPRPGVLATDRTWLPRRLESRTVSIVSNWPKRLPMPTKRSSPTPIRHRADDYRAMLNADPTLTRANLARRLGISRAAVTQALRRRRLG